MIKGPSYFSAAGAIRIMVAVASSDGLTTTLSYDCPLCSVEVESDGVKMKLTLSESRKE